MFSTHKDLTGLPEPIHHLISKDMDTMTGVCSLCGPVALYRSKRDWVTCGFRRNEYITEYRRDGRHERKYRKHLKPSCQRCGFIPEDRCQLDIHHLDQNHLNDKPENLETHCKNCHIFITKQQAFIKTQAKQMAARIAWVWDNAEHR